MGAHTCKDMLHMSFESFFLAIIFLVSNCGFFVVSFYAHKILGKIRFCTILLFVAENSNKFNCIKIDGSSFNYKIGTIRGYYAYF